MTTGPITTNDGSPFQITYCARRLRVVSWVERAGIHARGGETFGVLSNNLTQAYLRHEPHETGLQTPCCDGGFGLWTPL